MQQLMDVLRKQKYDSGSGNNKIAPSKLLWTHDTTEHQQQPTGMISKPKPTHEQLLQLKLGEF